ncbi:DUF3781 domain-containing protein [Ruminiclostridium papyrosolvens DSM 2782]|uniref:DUF3781 domain-containing protein n=1 Tax=Ruminiclostridium papyrosolvens TaxID=29362 RepID=UPI0009DA34C2|nr:DUF3781 domain-containing protein [Ruminiclostridium papyrosolvens]WES36649.1 DUF3781 domain-containing protein [Ruminiclostridium papyrosolvens DSM 2782]
MHTTDFDAEWILKNLRLSTADVVGWCRGRIQTSNASITRKGKNWYITLDNCEFTINAHSYTIITAHKRT